MTSPCILIFAAFQILIVHAASKISSGCDITLNKAANIFLRTIISMNDNLLTAHSNTLRLVLARHSMSIRDQSSVSQLPSIESKSSANIICRHVTRHPTAAGPYPRTSIHLGGIPKFSFCLPSSAFACSAHSISSSPPLPLSPSFTLSLFLSRLPE